MIDVVLLPDMKLFEAVKVIEDNLKRIAVVVSSEGRLKGTLTDGDVRRCLLNNGTLDTLVCDVMNKQPIVANVNSSDQYIIDLLNENNIRALPLVDSKGKYVRVVDVAELSSDDTANNIGFDIAVIMAGGEGQRLRPLTENIPKPMVKIGGIPILERQVLRLKKIGVKKIFISVNYLSYLIESHFGDGRNFGLEIEYLRENEKLGTAGALSLLPEIYDKSILVINGDVLTTSNFNNLFQFHADYAAAVTVAAIDYKVEIPYGVIRAEGALVKCLEEKPSQQFLCNAGIYALSPKILRSLPDTSFYNMTDLIGQCLKNKLTISVFPIHEYWSDIGTHTDLNKARKKFTNNAMDNN